MIFACWLSRGRSSRADCAWIKVLTKTIAMNTGASARFRRMKVPPGMNLQTRGDRKFRREARAVVSAGLISERVLIFQLCVHGDFCVEQLGDRTALFGVFGCFLEFCLIGARDLYLHLQMGRGDREAGVKFFQGYGGRGVNGLRRHSGIAELG